MFGSLSDATAIFRFSRDSNYYNPIFNSCLCGTPWYEKIESAHNYRYLNCVRIFGVYTATVLHHGHDMNSRHGNLRYRRPFRNQNSHRLLPKAEPELAEAYCGNIGKMTTILVDVLIVCISFQYSLEFQDFDIS